MSDQFRNLLAIETSTRELTLALSFGDDRLVKSHELVERSHGQVIARKVANLFDSAGLERRDLNGIVVSTGPGSFTGLRIGLAFAKGMASALQIPVVGVSLFELAAHKYGSGFRDFFAVVRVRKDELLVARILDSRVNLNDVTSVAVETAGQSIGLVPAIGLGLDIRQFVPEARLIDGQSSLEFDPADLLQIGRTRMTEGRGDTLSSLEPLYIQKSQAEIKWDLRHPKGA